MKIAMFLMTALLAASGPVSAQTDEQRNAVNHLADATYLAGRCPSMQVDPSTAGLIMAGYGITGEDLSTTGRFAPIVIERLATNMRATGQLNEQQICIIAATMFGPSGGNVPNLMLMR